MLKKGLNLAVLSATSLTLLTACGASDATDKLANAVSTRGSENNGSGINFNGNSSPNTGNAGGGVQLVSNPVVAVKKTGTHSFEEQPRLLTHGVFDITHTGSQDTFNLRREEANNTFIMTVNGVEYVLSANNYEGMGGVRLVSGRSNISGGGIQGVIDGTYELPENLVGFLKIIEGDYVSYTTNNVDLSSDESDFNYNYTKGYTTIGIQTLPSVIESQTAMATYTGRMLIDFHTARFNQDTAPKHIRNVAENALGFLTMTVDFDAKTVAGTADLFAREDIDGGTVTFGSAPINGNGFTGAFTLDNEARKFFGITNNPTGVYAGNFFGPNAEDLAGVISYNGTSINGAEIGVGGFRGDKEINE